MDVVSFVERWARSGAAERANLQLFIAELCGVLGVEAPKPSTNTPSVDRYVFEYPVKQAQAADHLADTRADLFKADCFLLEAKQGSAGGKGVKRGTPAWERLMNDAYAQALGYARGLDRPPPFLLVCDVGHCFDLYESFDGSGVYRKFPDALSSRLFVASLATGPELVATLRAIFEDPRSLDPTTQAAAVTREIAQALAEIARDLVPKRVGRREEDAAYSGAARFLMRCIFTMFAEDAKLFIDESKPFTAMLRRCEVDPARFAREARSLWDVMNTGGDLFGVGRVLWFNGGLFKETAVLPLEPKHLTLLREAAERDWTRVEPAIFGALLEWALDPEERRSFGIHYTPRVYVERLARPAIEEPLRRDWDAARGEALAVAETGAMEKALAIIDHFRATLCKVTVLDPACGTANFLYVAMEILRRLETEVLVFRAGLAGSKVTVADSDIRPENFLGIELNPWARELASLVFWMGYLQWYMRSHVTPPAEPILRGYGANILGGDAVVAASSMRQVYDPAGAPLTRWDGETLRRDSSGAWVPDERARKPILRYESPRQAEWPPATFIVGNPPFLGASNFLSRFGDEYVEALRAAYKNEVPESADYVMYWWHRAAKLVASGSARQFGFITTKAIGQRLNRKVVERALAAKDGLRLSYAIPNHPWVDAEKGAAVRIAMSVGARGQGDGVVARVVSENPDGHGASEVGLVTAAGRIHADLSVGVDLTTARALRANERICSPGVKLHGAGFIVTPDQAAALGLGTIEGMEKHIRPYRNGKDLASSSRDAMVIDLHGLPIDDVRDRFPAVYQHVRKLVKPGRDRNNEKYRRENWWLFGRKNTELREALAGVRRYIATGETSKHRYFVFLESEILPDNMVTGIALEDAFFLGVLSSQFHVAWALAAGGRLGVGNDPRYTKSRCFDPFPFPDASAVQRQRVRALAERLDQHRRLRQAAHPGLTMTGMYNVLQKVRDGEELTEKEAVIHEKALGTVLASLHDDVDAAVADAYGWRSDLTEPEILANLLALNIERAAEEKVGKVRWLRPDFQTRDIAAEAAGQATFPWPTDPLERQEAVRQFVEASTAPLAMPGIVKAFNPNSPAEVEAIVAGLCRLRVLEELDVGGERRIRIARFALTPPIRRQKRVRSTRVPDAEVSAAVSPKGNAR